MRPKIYTLVIVATVSVVATLAIAVPPQREKLDELRERWAESHRETALRSLEGLYRTRQEGAGRIALSGYSIVVREDHRGWYAWMTPWDPEDGGPSYYLDGATGEIRSAGSAPPRYARPADPAGLTTEKKLRRP